MTIDCQVISVVSVATAPQYVTLSRTMSNRFERHSILTLLIVATALVLLVLVALEALLTYTAPVGLRQHRYVRLRELPANQSTANVPSPRSMQSTDILKRQEYPFRTDSNGFIQPTEVHPAPDLRVFFLGGSTTECLYVSELSRFPYLAGRLIENKLHRKVNSYNAGVSGNHSFHSLISLQCKIVPLKPDVVVMMHNINDLITLFLTGTYYNNHPGRSLILTDGNSSRLHHLRDALFPNLYNSLRALAPIQRLRDEVVVADEWAHIRGQKIERDPQEILISFSENLSWFTSFCRIKGIVPVLMTQASRLTPEPEGVIRTQYEQFTKDYGMDYQTYRDLFLRMNDRTRDVARKDNVLLIDLAGRMPQSSQLMYDVVHFTDAGSKLAAEIISEDIARHFGAKGSQQ